MSGVRLRAAVEGDAAVLVTAEGGDAEARRLAALGLHRALRRRAPDGVADWIHAPESVLLVLEEPADDPDPITAAVLALDPVPAEEVPPRRFLLPVVFGGADGPDLLDVAAEAGYDVEEVIAAFTAADLVVAALGSSALPLLTAVGWPLRAARLASPRSVVPPGSVGVAGDRVCVYPVAMPGGWRLVGRTPAVLIDPAADPVGVLRPGDLVAIRPAGPDGGPAGLLRPQPG